jgi:predicted Co/Zn/Cd cation transporter (cation efflux family)
MNNKTQVVVTAGDLNQMAGSCIGFALFIAFVVYLIVTFSGWGVVSVCLSMLVVLLVCASIAPAKAYNKAMTDVLVDKQ